jgi:hypothetical protein
MDIKAIKFDWGIAVFITMIATAVLIYVYSDDKNNSLNSTIDEIKNYEFAGFIDTVYLNTEVRYYPFVKLNKEDAFFSYPITEKMFEENIYRKGDYLLKRKGDSIVRLFRNGKEIESYDYLLTIKNKGIKVDF